MSKLKTHSGCKKRFSFSSSGKIFRKRAYRHHNQRRRSSSMKAKPLSTTVFQGDAPGIRDLMPYHKNKRSLRTRPETSA